MSYDPDAGSIFLGYTDDPKAALPFNKCSLCGAPGDYAHEWEKRIKRGVKYVSPIQLPGPPRQMICANGHYFNPNVQYYLGKLNELEREYYNTFRE